MFISAAAVTSSLLMTSSRRGETATNTSGLMCLPTPTTKGEQLQYCHDRLIACWSMHNECGNQTPLRHSKSPPRLKKLCHLNKFELVLFDKSVYNTKFSTKSLTSLRQLGSNSHVRMMLMSSCAWPSSVSHFYNSDWLCYPISMLHTTSTTITCNYLHLLVRQQFQMVSLCFLNA